VDSLEKEYKDGLKMMSGDDASGISYTSCSSRCAISLDTLKRKNA
jgi:hypothetical protein